jgi:hypothetical protein
VEVGVAGPVGSVDDATAPRSVDGTAFGGDESVPQEVSRSAATAAAHTIPGRPRAMDEG